MRIRFYLPFLVWLTFSCSEEKRNSDEFIEIYKDILITREINQDSIIAKQKIDSIFRAHNTSEPVFRNNMIELSKDRKDFLRFIDSVRSLIKIEADSIRQKQKQDRIESLKKE